MNRTLAEAKFIRSKMLELAKRSHWYELLNRHYRKIDGYEPFSSAAKNLAYNLFAIEFGLVDGCMDINYLLQDFVQSSVVSAAWTLAHNPFPVWWLHKNLFEAFDASDLPKAIADMQIAAPFCIIMLPRDRVINPDGEPCDWVFFQHLPKGFVFPRMQFGRHIIESIPVECDKLRWITILRNGTCYASVVELAGDAPIRGEFEIMYADLIGVNEDVNLEEKFQQRIEKIVLQTLLYLQIRPDDLMPVSPAANSAKHLKANPKKRNERLQPLIIGQQFQPQIERASTSHSLPHVSPRVHWRRGHWRRVAIGEGRQQRDWRWIQPVLVNG